EFRLIGVIERAKAPGFVLGEMVEAGARLLPGGIRGQALGPRKAPRQIGMRLDQRHFLRWRSRGGHARHRARKTLGRVRLRAKPPVERSFGDPARMLVDSAEPLDEQ